MKNKIKAPFLKLCSRINLFDNNKLTPMQELEKQSVERAKVKLYPTFREKTPVVQYLDNLERIREAFARSGQRAYIKMLVSDRGQEILADADKYMIPYDKDNIDWLRLIDQIENYEPLLKEAEEHDVKWDYKLYDPIGLKQQIEECISQERKWTRERDSDYSSSRI